MCGIAGIVSVNTSEVHKERLKIMTNVIAHRGPDGEGNWISENGNVGLGHRRLSIIDLSHEADQPMHYLNRYSIVFNGEIYNYIELKEILHTQGYTFSTSSDTEVLMAMYDRDKEDCLKYLDGMFSFAIYDHKQNQIFAARDRFGEKPFYYSYEKGKHFIFGSEMKCLWAAGIDKVVNNKMLYNYLDKDFLVNPNDDKETFFTGCKNLPHGHYLILSVDNLSLTKKKYYDINLRVQNISITADEAQEKFRKLFYTSVSRRMRSDVPVGSSLSGGLDSSLVVCVIDELRKNTSQVQNTFSAVFPGFSKDERKYMDYVISRTNVSPHFITPDYEGMINNIDSIAWHQEEPFGTSSIYAQYCVMRLAKENNVTVLLDGQGADEFLAGYHYYYAPFFNELKRRYPQKYSEEHNAYEALHKDNNINALFKKDLKYYVRSGVPTLIDPLKKGLSFYKQKTNPFFSADFYSEHRGHTFSKAVEFNDLNKSLHQSILQGSMQTLLRYADRNSMAQSREVRLPFLYHELVEFVFSLPPYFKIHKGWTKWIMRQSFDKLLPPEINRRKDKIGYEPPQKNWMENKEVKEKIHVSKEVLFKKNIISKREYDRKITADGVLENNKSWALWMGGILFNKIQKAI